MVKFLPPLLFALATLPAGAWSGPLQWPQIDTTADLTVEQKAHYERAFTFMKEEMEFLGGRFHGAYSHHFNLGGKMGNVASLIWLLREVGVWKVTVVVGAIDEKGAAVTISQSGGSDQVLVMLNSAQEDFNAREFERFDPVTLEELREKSSKDSTRGTSP